MVSLKSEPDSDSSVSQKQQRKKSKRSVISDTEESTSSESDEDSEPSTPDEPAPLKHRRRQIEIRMKGSNEKQNMLRNRTNTLFDHEGVNEKFPFNKYYRRNPDNEFKPPPDKPNDGKSIKNHAKGKMMRASKIMEQQTAGRVLRPYLNGIGFQLRLAEAIRKLVELALPNVEKTIRYKGKNGEPSRLIRDPRLTKALATLRSVKRAEDALDQWKYPELGAHPVEKDQRKIPYVCLMDDSENETERRKAHPLCWMGKELTNDEIDTAKMLLSMFTYLSPAFQLGDMKGDAKHFDKAGNLKIEPEDPVSEPEKEVRDSEEKTDGEETSAVEPMGIRLETDTTEPQGAVGPGTSVIETNAHDSDSDIEIIEVLPKKPKRPIIVGLDETTAGEGIKVEPKSEPGRETEEPTPSTSTAGDQNRSTDNLAAIQEQILHLTRMVQEHVSKNIDSIAKNLQQGQAPEIGSPKLEPKDA